jgi:ATP-dependent Clp protease ATP-binding subunit ClpB
VGAPPGYVGYDEGGQLTEAVRRKPYSVILLDEIEKAHPDVFNVLLQVLDDGRLTDNKGRTVDFKNTILIMTSNLGSEVIQGYMEKISEMDNGLSREETLDECRNRVVDILKQSVRPEFVNRIDEIIMFEPLSKKDILGILNLQLDELSHKMAENDIHLTYTQSFVDYLSDKGFDPAYGARPIKRILQRELVNLLAKALIDGTVVKGQQVTVDVDSGNIVLK